MKKFVLQLTKNVAQVAMFCVLFCFCAANLMAQTHQLSAPLEYRATTFDRIEWVVPNGVTEVKIEGIGGGGAGGYQACIGTSESIIGKYGWQWATGGGGGAAYARLNTYTVEPGHKLIIYVGEGGVCTQSGWRDGGNTLVYYDNENNASLILKAEGGKSVHNDRDINGKAGGKKENCIGTVKYSGGNGGNGFYNSPMLNQRASGGGGGAAGTDGDGGPGGNAQQSKGGKGGNAGAGELGGAGGGGKHGYNLDGENGGNYGGGGSGAIDNWCNQDGNGGQGGGGIVRITYRIDACYPFPEVQVLAPPTDRCAGEAEYDVVATVTAGKGTISNYIWTDDAQGNTATGKIYPPSTSNCGATYNYTLTIKRSDECESAPKSGSFTIENPAISFNSVGVQNAALVGTDLYGVPDITDVLKSKVATGCGNTLMVINATPAVGTTLTNGTTTSVTYHVKDMCENEADIDVAIYAPTPGEVVTDPLTLTLTADKTRICAGDFATLTANVSGGKTPYTYVWTGDLQDGSAANNKKTVASTTIPASVTSATYSVKVTDNDGAEVNATITIYTNPAVASASNVTLEPTCAPFSYTYTLPSAPANTNYTWDISSVSGITNAVPMLTPQSSFFTYGLNNTSLATGTIVYTVSTETTTEGVACAGADFDITITLKPSIQNDPNFEISTTDASATLWHGACDTLMTLDVPTYHTDITEYATSLTLTPNMGTINSDGKLEIRLGVGENIIVWTVTDPCGYSVSKNQKVTIEYSPCTGTVDDGDGNSYEVVRLGCECWTKTNLKTTTYAGGGNIASAEGYYSTEYPNTSDNIDKFGRLYTWYSAVNVTEGDDNATPTLTTDPTSHIQYVQGICPQGWAIPSQESFQSAFIAAGETDNMKTTDGSLWLPGAAGTDASGFSAVGAGYYDSNIDRYVNLLGETYWWDDEAVTVSEAACSSITHTCPYLLSTKMNKHFGLSVRCVRRVN